MQPRTPAQARFEIYRGLQTISRSTLRDLGGAADKRQAALEAIADNIMGRFADWRFEGPDPIPDHGEPVPRR